MVEVLTTDQLIVEMAKGNKVYLPAVEIEDMSLLQNYDEGDLQHLGLNDLDNEIVRIEYVLDDEVQCIMVEDECHQYLTDNFIPTHNTNNIIYLKSNDDQMLQTLETLSGKKHVAHMDSKTITRDTTAIFGKLTGNEGKTSYTSAVREESVVSFNDLYYIPQRNAITFRAGDNPIWSRNEMVLPMAWRLHKNTIKDPGHEYSLATLPTLSSAREFDVDEFVPNFDEMLAKQMKRAMFVDEAVRMHKELFGLSDYDITKIPKEDYANTIMEMVDQMIDAEKHGERYTDGYDPSLEDDFDFDGDGSWDGDTKEVTENSMPNKEQEQANRQAAEAAREDSEPRFAGRQLSRNDIIDKSGKVAHNLDDIINHVYHRIRPAMQKDTENFTVDSVGNLCGLDSTPYITRAKSPALSDIINEGKEHGGVVHDFNGNADDGIDPDEIGYAYIINNGFYRFLHDRTTWADIADGKFENEMARQIRQDLNGTS